MVIESEIVTSPWTFNADSAPEMLMFDTAALPPAEIVIPRHNPAPVEPRLVEVSVVMNSTSLASKTPSIVNQ